MDLGRSTVSTEDLKQLQIEGSLPGRKTLDQSEGGTSPNPALRQIVCLDDYLQCNFLPLPEYLLLLDFYGIHLLHLNPNSIGFLSIFVHL
jgi:Putative gypsy type transposon.